MEGKRLIEKIRLRNILSFGDKGEEIELQPLNVIIGQNASGKSNLVDVIKLLRAIPQEKGLNNFIDQNGEIDEWLWKGKRTNEFAEMEVVLKQNNKEVNYYISFYEAEPGYLTIEAETISINSDFYYRENIYSSESIISSSYQQEDKKKIPMAWRIKSELSKITVYSDLQTNRGTEIRKYQYSDNPHDFLEEDGSNLALVLNDLEFKEKPKDEIVKNLRKFYTRARDYFIKIQEGTVQLFIREEGLEKPISAMRLSDGTLRYLCLLAILCHPAPPPLICIEEPETGLHPDILPTIAGLMKDAATRTQLIVTTHSDILVSAFSDMPEAILVCEKDEDGTHFKRLDAENLKTWLEEYTLGEVWLRGGIGGTRW